VGLGWKQREVREPGRFIRVEKSSGYGAGSWRVKGGRSGIGLDRRRHITSFHDGERADCVIDAQPSLQNSRCHHERPKYRTQNKKSERSHPVAMRLPARCVSLHTLRPPGFNTNGGCNHDVHALDGRLNPATFFVISHRRPRLLRRAGVIISTATPRQNHTHKRPAVARLGCDARDQDTNMDLRRETFLSPLYTRHQESSPQRERASLRPAVWARVSLARLSHRARTCRWPPPRRRVLG